MIYIIILLFLFCYFLCYKRKIKSLCILVSIFTTIFLYEIFGAFFFCLEPQFHFNPWLFLFGVLYFLFWFFSFYWLSTWGWGGGVIHSILMTLLSVTKIVLPLHPLILLYPGYKDYLPTFSYQIINLFLIFLIVDLLFCKGNKYFNIVLLLSLLSVSILFKSASDGNDKNVRVAIIQIGLYYEKGGDTSSFFSDMQNFLERNPRVNAIVFSENNLYSYKDKYNEELTEKLLENIFSSKLNDKYHLFLSFGAYKDINNIVTYYHYKNKFGFNQKKVLIPFVEKRGFINKKESIDSKYYFYDDNIKNNNIDLFDYSVSTNICYDALFPELFSTSTDLVFIQSNYKLLDRGYGHDKLKIYATYLAKFLNGVSGSIIINVQNHGGTVILSNDWTIDYKAFVTSKTEPFMIIDI